MGIAKSVTTLAAHFPVGLVSLPVEGNRGGRSRDA